jgi:hypothetical protein
MRIIRRIIAFVEAEEARQREAEEARSRAEHASFMKEFWS